MNKMVTKFKQSISTISFKQYIPVLVLATWFVMLPETSHALTLPWNGWLEEFLSELKITIRYLAIGGVMLTAAGLFWGNGGDGVKLMLRIVLAVCIGAYATTFVDEIMTF